MSAPDDRREFRSRVSSRGAITFSEVVTRVVLFQAALFATTWLESTLNYKTLLLAKIRLLSQEKKHYPSTEHLNNDETRTRTSSWMMPDRTDVQDSKSCAEYYGPYPKYDPVPTTKLADGNGASSTTDYRDVGTPDEWVTRDGEMVRLTGRHPFNSEPPLSLLKKYEFITPTHLHIVRNHGAVPKLKWETHTLLEINMIKQTIGFNWGAAGVGTNVWKGVAVRELLLKAGITDKDIADGTKHVEFVGFEDLPNKVGPGPFEDEVWGKHVKYGTSIPLGRAMSPQFDVIVAYEANGEKLLPDHGFPCRLIIPGYIGGRMIKWLKEIRVLKHESKNHYHYHDNKILPPTVDAERALKEGWWYRQEYILNELSLNSVIAQPNHNDTLPIARSINSLFEIGGYAHTGGGRPVVRVEISLDQGETWLTTEFNRKERRNPYGMYWCWVWWAISIPVADLVGCKEIWCRAWDSSQAPQPIKPTWTLMGQHANHVFRVKVHTRENESGEHFFWFEHPTQPGQLRGGWAERIVEKYDSAGYGRIDYASQ